MKKKVALLFGILALLALLAGAGALYDRMSTENLPAENMAPAETQSAEEEEAEPVAAPDFTVLDAAGGEVRLSDFVGKPVVLNFWASWCGPCKSEMPEFDEAYLQQGEEIQFLMVNMTDGAQETADTAMAFIAGSGYSFPVLYDVNYDAAITYGVSSLPTTYFIDAEGVLVAKAVGAIDAQTLQRGISMIAEE